MPLCSELIMHYHHIILMQWNDISSQQSLEINMHVSLKVFEWDSKLIFHPSPPPKLHLINPLLLNMQHHFLILYITSSTRADILGHSHRLSLKWSPDLSSPLLSRLYPNQLPANIAFSKTFHTHSNLLVLSIIHLSTHTSIPIITLQPGAHFHLSHFSFTASLLAPNWPHETSLKPIAMCLYTALSSLQWLFSLQITNSQQTQLYALGPNHQPEPTVVFKMEEWISSTILALALSLHGWMTTFSCELPEYILMNTTHNVGAGIQTSCREENTKQEVEYGMVDKCLKMALLKNSMRTATSHYGISCNHHLTVNTTPSSHTTLMTSMPSPRNWAFNGREPKIIFPHH